MSDDFTPMRDELTRLKAKRLMRESVDLFGQCGEIAARATQALIAFRDAVAKIQPNLHLPNHRKRS